MIELKNDIKFEIIKPIAKPFCQKCGIAGALELTGQNVEGFKQLSGKNKKIYFFHYNCFLMWNPGEVLLIP